MAHIENKDAERLGRELAAKAERRPEFIGSAFALWRDRNGPNVEEQLNCSSDVVWRLAVTPKPAHNERFAERVMELAVSLGANPTALIRLLRWADSVGAMQGAAAGDGMLKAALDKEPNEPR